MAQVGVSSYAFVPSLVPSSPDFNPIPAMTFLLPQIWSTVSRAGNHSVVWIITLVAKLGLPTRRQMHRFVFLEVASMQLRTKSTLE